MKIKTIIIDDEALARDIIKNYISQIDNIEIVCECTNGFEGLKAINEYNPDLIFLDIQMPKVSGFELLELLQNPPYIIFSTAFEEYALKAFEVNAIDYLLKPYSFERFTEAIKKAEKTIISHDSPQPINTLVNHISENIPVLNRIVIKQNSKITIIPTEEISVIEAQDDYVLLTTSKGKFLKEKTMKFFEEHLEPKEFIRIHRSYIVKISTIKQLELVEKDSYTLTTNEGLKLPVSKSGYQKLKTVLNY